MKSNWFKQDGIIFIPKSVYGWILLILALAYAVYSFIEIDRRSHSVSDTLMNFVFRLMLIVAAYTITAFLFSRNTGK
jgi:putative effector of murein hydrolase LrgA (UPF0299 family)